MPPTFKAEAFDFAGQEVPEHIDKHPEEDGVQLDPTKWHLEGTQPLDGDAFFFAANIDTAEDAQALAEAARREIDACWDPSMVATLDPEEFKPAVNVVGPNGNR